MIQKVLTVVHEEGVDMRSAVAIVQLAGMFDSGIWIEQPNKRVNAKSIMGIISLTLRKGDSFTVVASGTDEKQALAKIVEYIENPKE